MRTWGESTQAWPVAARLLAKVGRKSPEMVYCSRNYPYEGVLAGVLRGPEYDGVVGAGGDDWE